LNHLTHYWTADDAAIARAAAILRAGGLVAFPTETVYGLGANALDPTAVAGIYQAKGRPSNNPLIVHVNDDVSARSLAAAWPASAAALTAAFWPGPLTLVLPRSERVPDIVTGGGPTVALRSPAHPVARALIEVAGMPIAAPSANRSSELSPTRAEHVRAGLDGRIDAILDGGPTTAGIESTVVDLSGIVPRLLRPGPIPLAMLEALVGPFAMFDHSSGGPLPSPGMLERHYSPHTPLLCLESIDVEMLMGRNIGAIVPAPTGVSGVIERVIIPTPEAYAERLYDLLHELDGLGLDGIVAWMPPDRPEWLALRDRLRRASFGS